MKLGDTVNRVSTDTLRLTEYALNAENPVGANKALMFQRHLGFTRDNYDSLLEQISMRSPDSEAILQRTDQHGEHYRVDLEIIGTEGQREVVRTGWVVAPSSDEARLVTLYVRRQK